MKGKQKHTVYTFCRKKRGELSDRKEERKAWLTGRKNGVSV